MPSLAWPGLEGVIAVPQSQGLGFHTSQGEPKTEAKRRGPARKQTSNIATRSINMTISQG